MVPPQNWTPALVQLVRATQPAGGGAPQTPLTPPPPQVWPAGQAALQSRLPPQLLPTEPPQNWTPALVQLVRATQPAGAGAPQTPATPPPPQVWPDGHAAVQLMLP